MLFSNDTGILGKRNSEFSQQESNLRPSVGRTQNFFFPSMPVSLTEKKYHSHKIAL